MMIIPVEDLKQMGESGKWDKFFMFLGLLLFGMYVMVILCWDELRSMVCKIRG